MDRAARDRVIVSRAMTIEAAPPRSGVDKALVAASVERSPIVAVVRHHDRAEAARQARAFLSSALELVEITFTVPSEPGEYPYVCSFPAHYVAGMRGVLVVQ